MKLEIANESRTPDLFCVDCNYCTRHEK